MGITNNTPDSTGGIIIRESNGEANGILIDEWNGFNNLSHYIIPIKSLHDANARVTLSSDWDVSSLNPFVGLPRTPQQLSLEDAVRAYTINAAYLMWQEDIVGSLEEGKEADFIILDRYIFNIPATQINQTKVNETYLKGGKFFKR